MTTSPNSSPPSSELRRGVELNAVRDVMLLEPEERRAQPIERTTGERAMRGVLEGQLRGCIAAYDLGGERDCSIQLARLHFERGLDLDRGVQLLHRALEIQDDRELRQELVRQLVMMGRHLEAGHVLRDGELPAATSAVDQWLSAGDAYARAGDLEETLATFREAALLAPDDPRPFERIAAISFWRPDILPAERAADALIEASKRYPQGSAAHILSLTRACEIAPAYARGTQALAAVLRYQGRPKVADELWRDYALASEHGTEVARQLLAQAREQGDYIAALFAALDGCWTLPEDAGEVRFEPLQRLLEQEDALQQLNQFSADNEPFTAALLAAARTRSNMARADAFMKLSRRMRGEARAVMLVYASEGYASAGNMDRALAAGSLACEVCPWLPRAHANLVAVAGDALDARSLETALAVLPARALYCEALAARHQSNGELELALAWTRRIVAMRPGDLWPLTMLLRRAIVSGDPALIADAIAYTVELPRPCNPLSDRLAEALDALMDLDVDYALDMGRVVLETTGPGLQRLYNTLRTLAARAEDRDLEALLTARRAVGDDVEDNQRAALYLEAAELCREYGNIEVACEHLCCAAAHAGPLDQLQPLLEQLRSQLNELPAESRGDAMLALAHAEAWTAEQQDSRTAVLAWRRLAALRWDVADDALRAEEAYFIACAQDPEHGPYRYARDLEHRAGAAGAVDAVVERAMSLLSEEGSDARLCAKLYAAAARVAADNELYEVALNAAVAAVQTDASRADAVALVEKIADGDRGLDALIAVYNTLADAALGSYGYRAAHYRAARQLEQRKAYQQALRHAILAFEAVPGVGASYQLLLRLASRTGDEGAAIRTLAGVASSFPPEGQMLWLLRAAELSREAPDGQELRFDLLLKVFKLRPSVELLEQLSAVADELGETSADRELVHTRLQRAITAAVPDLKGPRAAPTMVALSTFAAAQLQDAPLAVELLLKAITLDRRHTDYSSMLPHADMLVAHPEAGQRLLSSLKELAALASGPFDAGLKALAARMHTKLSDAPPTTSEPKDTMAPSSVPDPVASWSGDALADSDRSTHPSADSMAGDDVDMTLIETLDETLGEVLSQEQRAELRGAREPSSAEDADGAEEVEPIAEPEPGEEAEEEAARPRTDPPDGIDFATTQIKIEPRLPTPIPAPYISPYDRPTLNFEEMAAAEAGGDVGADDDADEHGGDQPLLNWEAPHIEDINNFADRPTVNFDENLQDIGDFSDRPTVNFEEHLRRTSEPPEASFDDEAEDISDAADWQADSIPPEGEVGADAGPVGLIEPEELERPPLTERETGPPPDEAIAAETLAEEDDIEYLDDAELIEEIDAAEDVIELDDAELIEEEPVEAELIEAEPIEAEPIEAEAVDGELIEAELIDEEAIEAAPIDEAPSAAGTPAEAPPEDDAPELLIGPSEPVPDSLASIALDVPSDEDATPTADDTTTKIIVQAPAEDAPTADAPVEDAVAEEAPTADAPTPAADAPATDTADDAPTPSPLAALTPPEEPEIAPAPLSFSPASERRARERGDHQAIADMLAARAASTDNVEQRRLIRLRRAAVLEQRLQKLDEAKAELEVLLAENGDDITALRYLADLSDRSQDPARAARLWLSASRLAQSLDEKLRDVIRCCNSLLEAGKPKIAKRLIDAARELPQSSDLLDTRLRVAQALSDEDEIREAQRALSALDTSSSRPGPKRHHTRPETPIAKSDKPPRSNEASAEPGDGPEIVAVEEELEEDLEKTLALATSPQPAAAKRQRYRVRSPGTRPEGEVTELLERCRQRYLSDDAGELAEEDVRVLKLIRPELSDGDIDLYTFLLVEALEASGDKATATHELQHHWEHRGATPLVTLAVGDRLLRKGGLEQALRMYRRLLDTDLHGLRSKGQLALDAAEAAVRIGDVEQAEELFEIAAGQSDTGELARERLATLLGRTSNTPALNQTEPLFTPPPPPPPPRTPLPSVPHIESADQERLLEELRQGSFEAGEALVAGLSQENEPRTREILQVRRHQVALRPGDLDVLRKLESAARDDYAIGYARAVDHVIASFDADRRPISPPPLSELPGQPEATSRMLFGDFTGTINEALALLCNAGVQRRELTSYNFTGTDRVPPTSATPVGRIYAELSRLVDLRGARLFHRARNRDRLSAGVALLSPLSAILSGKADEETPELRYILGSALAAATPPLAMVEGLDETTAQDIIGALRTGFGRVEDSVAGASVKQMRMAEDMWHMVPAAADRRLRELCEEANNLRYDMAVSHTRRARRRVGLFAAGDIRVAMSNLIDEIGIDIPHPLRSPIALHRLAELPEAEDLLLLALSPQYAQARWQV